MRRSGLGAIAVLALTLPATAQYPVNNSNSFELDNGIENINTWSPIGVPTTGNLVGTGVVNVPPPPPGTAYPMFYVMLPREAMTSSNGTVPATMELVSNQAYLFHSWWGIAGAGSTAGMIWDQTINFVQYVNPISGVGPDGRRYPNLTVAPLVTIPGGPSGLPPPLAFGCPPLGFFSGYVIEFDWATPVVGSGITVPADGTTELAWCFWQPAGMFTPAASPDGCELGGTLSLMSAQSSAPGNPERVPAGVLTIGGVSKNPFGGRQGPGALIDNRPNTQIHSNWPGFREPIIEPNFTSTLAVPAPFAGPERGSGAWFMDGTVPGTTVSPGFRTQATAPAGAVAGGLHVGDLVVHVVSADLVNFPPFAQPGIPVSATANLLVNPADPNFFLLTPALDTPVAFLPDPLSEFVVDKDVADTAMPFVLAGGIAPPGITVGVQAFLVNFITGSIVSTNLIRVRLL